MAAQRLEKYVESTWILKMASWEKIYILYASLINNACNEEQMRCSTSLQPMMSIKDGGPRDFYCFLDKIRPSYH